MVIITFYHYMFYDLIFQTTRNISDAMLEKTEKIVNIRKSSRSFVSVVREHYLRNDIPCKSLWCTRNCVPPKGKQTFLPIYFLPDSK